MRIHIDGELRDWSAAILQEITSTGFDKETITSKLMECGVMVRSGILPVPKYWPKPSLALLHNIIMELPLEEKNFIVGKRILGYSYSELGKMIKKSKWTAMNRMDEIEKKLLESLQNSPILLKSYNR